MPSMQKTTAPIQPYCGDTKPEDFFPRKKPMLILKKDKEKSRSLQNSLYIK
jgi:hypothetical protein